MEHPRGPDPGTMENDDRMGSCLSHVWDGVGPFLHRERMRCVRLVSRVVLSLQRWMEDGFFNHHPQKPGGSGGCPRGWHGASSLRSLATARAPEHARPTIGPCVSDMSHVSNQEKADFHSHF